MTAGRRDALLALHTTDTPGALAVRRGGQVSCRSLSSSGQHAASLLGNIEALLAGVDAEAGDLCAVAVTRGPGSFTGIRIGLATAQGLAQAAGLQVAVCDSLEAEAMAQRTPGWLGVVLDARRQEVYAGLYRIEPDAMHVALAPFVAAPAPALARLQAAVPADATLRLTGGGAGLLAAPDSVHRVDTVDRTEVARALVESAAAGRLTLQAPRALEPLYLRKSDAELHAERRRQTGFGAR